MRDSVIVTAQRTSIWTVVAQPLFVAVLSVMLALMCGLAFGQTAKTTSSASTPHGNFYDACPSGHRVEFQIGSRTLYIDPHWLGLASEIPLRQRFGANCPSQPVKVSKLYFHSSILDAMDMPGGLGRPFFFMVIKDQASLSSTRMTKLGLQDTPPLKQTAQPYAEDVTLFAFRTARPPAQSPRIYRVVYPGAGNEPPSFVEVSCGGDPSQPKPPGPGRTCFTPIGYSYLGTLTVDYKFRQDRLPFVGVESDPPTMREPEGVLAFDGHIRAWLDSLTKKQ
jgi:hypothetical protein